MKVFQKVIFQKAIFEELRKEADMHV